MIKSIGNIFLVWRKGQGSRRIKVGIIRRNSSEGIRFEYIQDGVKEAKAEGFIPYQGFPDLNKEYKENVIETFGQRLMRVERNDLTDFYSFWNIDKKYKDDKYYMLAYTQGMLPTDSFEFLAEFKPNKELKFVTEISGLSHNPTSINDLKIGDILDYKKETNNDYDQHAVSVYKEKHKLGYVKIVHNRVFYKAKRKLTLKVKLIESYENRVMRIFAEVE